MLRVVAQLCSKDAIVDDRECQIAEKLIWVLEFSNGFDFERLPEKVEHTDD